MRLYIHQWILSTYQKKWRNVIALALTEPQKRAFDIVYLYVMGGQEEVKQLEECSVAKLVFLISFYLLSSLNFTRLKFLIKCFTSSVLSLFHLMHWDGSNKLIFSLYIVLIWFIFNYPKGLWFSLNHILRILKHWMKFKPEILIENDTKINIWC